MRPSGVGCKAGARICVNDGRRERRRATLADALRAAGADAYLTKPLDIDHFLATLGRFLPAEDA